MQRIIVKLHLKLRSVNNFHFMGGRVSEWSGISWQNLKYRKLYGNSTGIFQQMSPTGNSVPFPEVKPNTHFLPIKENITFL